MKKLIATLSVITLLFLLPSCTVKNDYSSIEKSIDTIASTGSRIYGGEKNFKFVKDIQTYLSKNISDKWNIETQKYEIENPYKCEIKIKSENDEIILNNTNCVFEEITPYLFNDKDIKLINNIENLDESQKYILISEDKNMMMKTNKMDNIIMFLQAADKKEYNIDENGFNTIYSENGRSNAIIKKSTAKSLEKYIESDLQVTCNVEFNQLPLENIVVTLKGKNNSEAILVTAHLDSVTTSGEKNYSKGVLDNGSGVALILDFIKKFEKSDDIPERDIVFSFVNSEEQAMILGNGGSKEVNKLMSIKYDYFLNINLDCLGQKGINDLRYGIKGSVNETFIKDLMIKTNNNKYKLIRDDDYGSDHFNFDNSIYIYNYDKENVIFHKEVDNKSNIDVKSLEEISNIICETIKELSIAEKEKFVLSDINDANIIMSKCDDKFNLYTNILEFGQYVFFKCESPNICNNIDKHCCKNNRYLLTLQDILTLKEDKKLKLPFEQKINIDVVFDLPELKYGNQELNVPQELVPPKSDFEAIKKLYKINAISYSYYLDAKIGKIYNCSLYDLTKQIGNYALDDIKNAKNYETIVKGDYIIHKGSSTFDNEYIIICIKNFDGTDYMMVVSSNIETPYTDDNYIVTLTSELYEKIIKHI